MTTVKPRFTPELRLQALDALAASNNDYDAVAGALGITRRTLVTWKRQRPQIVQQVAHDLQDQQSHDVARIRLDKLVEQLLESLPGKIENAKLSESVRAVFMLQELQQSLSLPPVERASPSPSPFREKLASLIERLSAESNASAQRPPASGEDDDPDDFDPACDD